MADHLVRLWVVSCSWCGTLELSSCRQTELCWVSESSRSHGDMEAWASVWRSTQMGAACRVQLSLICLCKSLCCYLYISHYL